MNTFTEPDPAERSAFNRLFYRNPRPTWLGHWVSQFFCWWARLGLPPQSWFALEVRDRISGRMRADAVVVPTVAGQRYIVSMFGTISDWVHNVDNYGTIQQAISVEVAATTRSSGLTLPLKPGVGQLWRTRMFFSSTRSSSLSRRFVLPFMVFTHMGASVIRALLLGFTLLATSATAPFANAQKVELSVDASKAGPKIDRNIFGQFAEHLGHGVYEGIWVGPDSTIPNTRSIRNDVVAALKAIHVPNVRWPGGCFADEYH